MRNTSSVMNLLPLACATALAAPALADSSWTDHAVNPVTNPIFFESPLIQSEVRPLFVHHRLDDGFVGADGAASSVSCPGPRISPPRRPTVSWDRPSAARRGSRGSCGR